MATHATMPVQYSQQELKDRRSAVESALGTTLAEGVSPSTEVLALLESYARGEVSMDEIIPAIKALDQL